MFLNIQYYNYVLRTTDCCNIRNTDIHVKYINVRKKESDGAQYWLYF